MKFFTLILFLGISVSVFSQDNFDKRLLVKYEKSHIESLMETNPSVVAFWSYYLDHGYSIIQEDGVKDYPYLKTINLSKRELKSLNLFDLDLPQPLNQATFYKIANTNSVLVLNPRKNLVQSFNNFYED